MDLEKERSQTLNEIQVVIGQILLADKDLMLSSVPSSCPIFICPAKTKRHVTFSIGQHFVKWSVQNARAREPIIVITESVDAILFGKPDLFLPESPADVGHKTPDQSADEADSVH